MTQGRPLLRVQNVSKKYGRGREATTALDDISLDVRAGELLAITGPSGSGKTTLSHIIGGLTASDSGSIEFMNSKLARQSDKLLAEYRNQKVGFVFQNFSLIPYYSVIENVFMPLVVQGIPKTERTMRTKRLLKVVGLEKRMHARADTLSGGEKQRVVIASALAQTNPVQIENAKAGSTDWRLTRVARPGSLIFLVSDFRRLGADYDRQLKQLALHCDLLLVHCYDAVEAELPPPGRYRIQGAGRSFSIETANEATRRRYHERFAQRRSALEAMCRTPGIRLVDCPTDADPRSVLNQKFRSR